MSAYALVPDDSGTIRPAIDTVWPDIFAINFVSPVKRYIRLPETSVYLPPWKLAQYQIVCATLIPLRAVTEPRPNFEQLTFPVMLTASASAFTEDWAATDG